MKNIVVADVTLKAIEELGCGLTFREKLTVSSKLDELNINAIELPELNGSKDNEVIFKTIATSLQNAKVKIPVGVSEESVKNAWETVKGAKNPVLQIVMPTSTVQMEYFYHLKAPAMISKIEELVKTAKTYCNEVEFVAKDAFRAEEGFIVELAKIALSSGATAITIYDDANVAFPEDYAKMVKQIKSACEISVFVAPSNALTMSAVSAIESIKAGADGVITSVKGDYLSPVVLAEIFRAKGYDLNATCTVDITKAKTVVSSIENMNQETMQQTTSAVTSVNDLSSNSSMQQVANVVKELGYDLDAEDIGKIYEEYKRISGKKATVTAKELEAVIASTAMQVPSTYHLINYVVNSSNVVQATANVTLEKNGERLNGVSTGDGPIDAAFHAIEQVVGHHYELDDFQVQAVTKGREAVGSSIIRLRANGKVYSGNGVSTDIIGACIRAYINALNKIVYGEN